MKPAQHQAITLAPATDTRVWARGGDKYFQKYKSSLRHVHDPVLLPLKVEVVLECAITVVFILSVVLYILTDTQTHTHTHTRHICIWKLLYIFL